MISFTSESMIPQEKLYQNNDNRNSLNIGIPKEVCEFEKRLLLTPEAVAILIEAGHNVLIESGAGESIYYNDISYSEAGAQITDNRQKVWESDIVLKVSSPLYDEIEMMRTGSCLISMLQFSLMADKTIEKMIKKRIIAVSLELIADKKGNHPIINSILEIEGKTSVMIASELLTNLSGGKGILLGGCAGVSPTEIVVIGAGRAGREAARTANALGALVKVFDNDIDHLRDIHNFVSQSIFTSTLHPNVLLKAFVSADVVIGTLRFENGEKHFQINEDIIRTMKKGAIILDLSVDQGGCFETSVCPDSIDGALYENYGITHYCLPNISSRVARTTTIALSNHFLPLLLKMAESQSIVEFIRKDTNFRSGVYIYKGKIVNKVVGEYYNLTWSDIMLFIASFQ